MDRVTLRFTADGQSLHMGGHLYYASQIVNYIEAEFDLKNSWRGFDAVSAIWSTPYATIATVLDLDAKCMVPNEVLSRKGKVTLNLVGTKSEDDEIVDRLTTYPIVAIIVDAAVLTSGSETQTVTPSQFEQFVAAVSEAVATIRDIESIELNSNYTLTFTLSDGSTTTVGPIRGEQGPQGEQGVQGETGETGADGYSPSASVVKEDGVATITITDANGTTTAEIYDGTDGVTDVEVDGISVVEDGVASIDLSGKADIADLSTVATSGDYDDLTNKPTIPTISVTQVVSTGTEIADITISGTTTAIYAPSGGSGTVTDVEVDGTSVVSGGVASIDLTGKANVADLATVATTGDYDDLTDKPTIPTITDTYSGTSSDGMSGKAVKSAIDALDGTVSGSAGSGKTLTAFSQTDGKVSATFGNISITKSQVSDFPTIPTKVSDLTNDTGFITLADLPVYDGSVE